MKLRRRNFLHLAAGAGQMVFPPPKEALIPRAKFRVDGPN
ncbi:hypothetical protein AB7M42_000625 [Bradyrhizobium diazoefficiens]|jgi:hypothetical protein|nr:hypothetical protein [Bradyrhizobium japonicum]MBP1097905.1 hypothetical protein [Bradyrhizobium japonicum]